VPESTSQYHRVEQDGDVASGERQQQVLTVSEVFRETANGLQLEPPVESQPYEGALPEGVMGGAPDLTAVAEAARSGGPHQPQADARGRQTERDGDSQGCWLGGRAAQPMCSGWKGQENEDNETHQRGDHCRTRECGGQEREHEQAPSQTQPSGEAEQYPDEHHDGLRPQIVFRGEWAHKETSRTIAFKCITRPPRI
jgi:hypothetical protein